MSRIDYSKWDHLEDSDDEEDKTYATARPTVTRLEQPSRVTAQSDGSIRVEPQPAPAAAAALKTTTTTLTESNTVSPASPSTSAIRQANEESTAKVPASWNEKGGEASIDVHGQARVFLWSQDRYSVTYRILLEKELVGAQKKKRWTCRVDNILSYDQRTQAVGSLPQTLVVAPMDKEEEEDCWFKGELPHPVHLPENESECDWCIEEHLGSRYMVLRLSKAVPMLGVILWWKRPFSECAEIDMSWCQSNQDFQKAWEEAHASFKANVATKSKRTV